MYSISELTFSQTSIRFMKSHSLDLHAPHKILMFAQVETRSPTSPNCRQPGSGLRMRKIQTSMMMIPVSAARPYGAHPVRTLSSSPSPTLPSLTVTPHRGETQDDAGPEGGAAVVR